MPRVSVSHVQGNYADSFHTVQHILRLLTLLFFMSEVITYSEILEIVVAEFCAFRCLQWIRIVQTLEFLSLMLSG